MTQSATFPSFELNRDAFGDDEILYQEMLKTIEALQEYQVHTYNSFQNIAPVGAIIGWHKALTNTPVLTGDWVECNGQTLSDSKSVYDGVVMPNLNSGQARFLRGSATSGTTQAEDFLSHNHTQDAHGHAETLTIPYTVGIVGGGSFDTIRGDTGASTDNNRTKATLGSITNATATNQATGGSETRPINMSVVWIIRVK